jgi:hypothetical protein
MKIWLPIGLLVLTLMPNAARAQDATRVEVDPGDTPLTITGWSAEGAPLAGNLRLTARNADVRGFTFLASDLVHADGDEEIDRQQVSLVGDPSLKSDVPQDFQVEVGNPGAPGTFEGQIEILLPDQLRADALVIPLKVTVKEPVLTPLAGSEAIRLELVQCRSSWNCRLAGLLLPASATQDSWQLSFDNATDTKVQLIDADFVLIGKHSGYPLTDDQLGLSAVELQLPSNQIVEVPLALDRSRMPPDHYQGSVYLSVQGSAEPLEIPTDIKVRTGPLWPLLFLLFGVLVGRLVKFMQATGTKLADALAEVYRVQALVRQAHEDDRDILLPALENVRAAVVRGDALEKATKDLTAIEGRLELLEELRTIEPWIERYPDETTKKKAREIVSDVRRLLVLKRDEEAEKVYDRLLELLKLKETSKPRKEEESGDSNDLESWRRAMRHIAPSIASKPERAGDPDMHPENEKSGFNKLMERAIGKLSEFRANAVLLVRPLLWLVLLLGLLGVGLQSLYVENGATFGANPVPDVLGLILWGLSADVASRTLFDLGSPSGQPKG